MREVGWFMFETLSIEVEGGWWLFGAFEEDACAQGIMLSFQEIDKFVCFF